MRTALHILSIGLIAIIFVAICGAWFVRSSLYSVGDLNESKIITIKSGDNISQLLQDEGVIENAALFRIVVRLQGKSGALQAGEYKFDAHTTLAQVIRMLTNGDVVRRFITIPEGLTSYQIVQLISKNDNLSGTIEKIPQEGSLLPETYHFNKRQNRNALIQRMRDAMDKTINGLWENRADNLPFDTKQDAIILASIVEKETSLKSEYPIVASVFINRLHKGMKLQTDPTVIYAITKGKPKDNGKGPLGRRILRSDLSIDSPYNTYLHAGLPPAPISNPGVGAIKGVLHPAEYDYLFFVADANGGHAFATTLKEHNKNVARWRKSR